MQCTNMLSIDVKITKKRNFLENSTVYWIGNYLGDIDMDIKGWNCHRLLLLNIVVVIFFGGRMTMNRINAVCVLTSHMQTINSGNVQCCAFHCKHYSSIIFYDDDGDGEHPFRVFLIELWMEKWEYAIKLVWNRIYAL